MRLSDREASTAERLVAARNLVEATRAESASAQHATNELLLACAGLSDSRDSEIAAHEQLLELLLNNSSLLAQIEQRLLALLELRELTTASVHTYSPIVVAARLGNQRLDALLRRLLRRHGEVGTAIVSSLRTGIRKHGAGNLLLGCWRDQVSHGTQANTPKWAAYWFAGQPSQVFADLSLLRSNSQSHADRVRCCLAMGCSSDDSTLPVLLTALQSSQRDEAYAAAMGISALPHRVLKQLLPMAKERNASTMRAILARAGLQEATAWLKHLELNQQQLRLLKEGSVQRFPEVVTWFQLRTRFTD
jgi:hypothetical protein